MADRANGGSPSGDWETLASDLIHAGRVIKLYVETIRVPSGRTMQREIVEHPGAVAMVALDADGNVLLVRQYRAAARRFLLEIPAGTLKPGEPPEECARRELAEETGYRPGKLTPLTSFFSAPGFCSEVLHLFLATDLAPSAGVPDEDEDIQLVRLPLQECLRLAREGEIRDAKSLVGLLAVQAGWARDGK